MLITWSVIQNFTRLNTCSDLNLLKIINNHKGLCVLVIDFVILCLVLAVLAKINNTRYISTEIHPGIVWNFKKNKSNLFQYALTLVLFYAWVLGRGYVGPDTPPEIPI